LDQGEIDMGALRVGKMVELGVLVGWMAFLWSCVAATVTVDHDARIVLLDGKSDGVAALDVGRIDVFHVACGEVLCRVELSLGGEVSAADGDPVYVVVGSESGVLRYREALLVHPEASPPPNLSVLTVPVDRVNDGVATLEVDIDDVRDFGLVHAAGAPGTVESTLHPIQ
jgi:hypothetical protein